MEPTLKRKLGAKTATSCQEACGEYCYCRCLGTFHGISHQSIIEREAQLRAQGRNIDECTCNHPNKTDQFFKHDKTGIVFQVCRNCGGRVAHHLENPASKIEVISSGFISNSIRPVSYGVRVRK